MAMEVIFTFSFKGTFQFFCFCAPMMDRVVESVRVTRPLDRTTTAQRQNPPQRYPTSW